MNFTARQKMISCLLKIVVIVSAIVGTILSARAGRGTFMGGNRVFMYFTIQSNLALAAICAIGLYKLAGGKPVGTVWHVIKLVGAVAITLTGMVFCFVLAPTMGDKAWNLQNILTHVIVPLVSVIDFFVTGVHGNIRKKNVIWVIVPPLLYAIYAGIGYVLRWEFAKGINYPYFFLNWGSPAGALGFCKGLPFMGCMWWILLLLLFLIAVGFLYLRILDLLKKTAKRA